MSQSRKLMAMTVDTRIDSIPEHLRSHLARFGPFRGGAQETLLLAITGLAQVGPRSELATGATRDTWPQLRDALQVAGLLEERALPGSARPYLRFSRDLADDAWQALSDDQRQQLERRHQRNYFQYVGQMGKLRRTHPDEAASLVEMEMDNLLAATRGAIDAGEEWALEFVERLAPFLQESGREDEAGELRDRVCIHYDPTGSPGWLRQRSNDAERLIQAGEFAAARDILDQLLEQLPESEPFARMANLARRAQCSRQLNELPQSLADLELALKAGEQAPESVAGAETRQRIHLDQAALFAQQGALTQALAAGQKALRESEGLKDWSTMAQVADIQIDLATKLQDPARIGAYRRLRRLAIACTDEGRAYLADQQSFIADAVAATRDTRARKRFEDLLQQGERAGWSAGVRAMRRILDGERDENSLDDHLEWRDAILVHAVLQELGNRAA